MGYVLNKSTPHNFIPGNSFSGIAGESVLSSRMIDEKFLSRFDASFKHLNEREKSSLLTLATLIEVEAGDVVIGPGVLSDKLYVVDGVIAMMRGESCITGLPVGGVFGEAAFVNCEDGLSAYFAEEDSVLLSIDIPSLPNMTGSSSYFAQRLADSLDDCYRKKIDREFLSLTLKS